MDLALHDEQLTPSEKCQINRCRIYLKVTHLSDIVNASGTHILRDSLECLPAAQHQSEWLWPRQPRPGPKHRAVWKKFLLHHSRTETLKLHKHLGGWRTTTWTHSWKCYYDTNLLTIILLKDNIWHHYTNFECHRHLWRIFSTAIIVDNTPPSQLRNVYPLDIIDRICYEVCVPLC